MTVESNDAVALICVFVSFLKSGEKLLYQIQTSTILVLVELAN